jgi:hypothetical protein
MIDGRSIGNGLTLVCRSRSNCSGQDVSVDMLQQCRPETREHFAIKNHVDPRWRSGGGNGQVLKACTTVWHVGVVWNTKQFLSLLLFKSPHLVLEHFALEQTLTFVLKTLKLDALHGSQSVAAGHLTTIERTADSSGILVPNLAAYEYKIREEQHSHA